MVSDKFRSIFRSERMALCHIYIQTEAAYSIVAALGEHEIVQFRDLNKDKPKTSKKYINEVKLCEETEGKLYYLNLEVARNRIKLKKYYEDPPAPSPRQIINLMIPGTADFDLLRKLYSEVKEMNYNMAPMKYTLQLHLEYQAILKTACSLLYTNMRRLFVVLVHGELFKNTVLKLCEGFSVILYDIPESKWKCSELYMKNKSEIADLKKVIANSNELFHRVLNLAATNLRRWLIEVKKMKAVYHTLNKFEVDASESFLVAECWIPVGNMEILNELLVIESKNSGGEIKPIIFRLNYVEPPPTYFRLNKVTVGFQNIIDAYGIASYKELNPNMEFTFYRKIYYSVHGYCFTLYRVNL